MFAERPGRAGASSDRPTPHPVTFDPAVFVHAVYFWLREDLSSAERAGFAGELRTLSGIDVIQHAYVGTPAPTDRPIIERGYSYALVLVFADQAAHDVYQDHPVHDRFRTECARLWTRVQIYDSVTA